MFKKSEEQEWTRFRGALSKDRDEAAPAPATTADMTDSTNSAAAAGSSTLQGSAGPSFRPSAGDVNVGLPSPRAPRSQIADGSDVESLIGEHTTFEGTLKTEGAVRLLGSIQGEIESKSTIFVE